MRLASLLALALALACAAREPTPDATYRAFARAAGERDAERTWGLLSSDTRAWLDAQAKTVAASAPGVVAPTGRQLVLGDAALARRPLASVLVLRESPERALVEATEEGGAKREVELVREEGSGWRVRIPPPPGS